MKLTLDGLAQTQAWQDADIRLPAYDVRRIAENTKQTPTWLHFGAGNIFRIFMGGIADDLIEQGASSTGIICAESFDFDVVHSIYRPYDNLVLAVTLRADGTTDQRVLGSLCEAVCASSDHAADWARLKTIFCAPSLQVVSFTITEKGYALQDANGTYFPFIYADIENGPAHVSSAIAITCAMLWERYQAGSAPLAVLSVDNCSHNGEKLRTAVLTMAQEWHKRGFVDAGFMTYLSDERVVSFPWSMIDKITPRPADSVYEALTRAGVEQMQPVITSRNTYIAPFVNAEGPQYLVIEDRFPNGRPAWEQAGVYLTDRDTVNRVERMKVTTCLNPLHTALAVYGCLLGYTRIAAEMQDEQLIQLVHEIGLTEGMPVVTDPGILSPAAFVDEVIRVRFPNPFMPDSPQRIATDTSQKVGVRYGETIKAYVAREGSAARLHAIPLAIAGWCRYLLGVDDNGQTFERSADPMLEELTRALEGVRLGDPASYTGQLRPILSNQHIFGIDLYEAGIGDKIERLFVEEIAGVGAVRETLQKHLA